MLQPVVSKCLFGWPTFSFNKTSNLIQKVNIEKTCQELYSWILACELLLRKKQKKWRAFNVQKKREKMLWTCKLSFTVLNIEVKKKDPDTHDESTILNHASLSQKVSALGDLETYPAPITITCKIFLLQIFTTCFRKYN